VGVGRILDHDHVFALPAGEAELGNCGGRIFARKRSRYAGSDQARATTCAPFFGPIFVS
jgi:hypothetical protein